MNQQQQRVLELHQQMSLSPTAFTIRWRTSAAEIATICGVSRSSANHWLGGRSSRRIPAQSHQRTLAVVDFLLTHADRMQTLLEQWHHSNAPEQ